MKEGYFPIFISLKQKRVKIFGGGTIALRRTAVLLDFCNQVEIIAPHICSELSELCDKNLLTINRRPYQRGDCRGAFLVIAATNDKLVNAEIAKECEQLGILISVASNKDQCTFLFPAIICEEDIIVGVTSGGQNHSKVKRVAENIRKIKQELLGGKGL